MKHQARENLDKTCMELVIFGCSFPNAAKYWDKNIETLLDMPIYHDIPSGKLT